MQEHISHSLEETENISKALIDTLKPSENHATVLALSGDLGSGKTTFVQLLGKLLGVKDQIISPTFILMKRYKTKHHIFKEMIHIDAYRIEDEKEFNIIKLNDLVQKPNTLICIEWPENIPQHLPEYARTVKFKFIDENTRSISF